MLGNQSVRFLKVEFCLITGLRFGVVPDTTNYAAVENGIHQRYFPGTNEVSLEEIMGVVTIVEFRKVFAFKVIPYLAKEFGARRVTDLTPRILK
ncbi:hypothetical protein Ddye_012687 [Dipteronia dyeriana]|uniref:Uncharacterized protein n=1 Tax=Dipteronia dyeriana TaxID=168575 RepID=A0AAD9X4T0_9ROSI|nr:hypothetical protein Ddye_012687 [Dipteronia dyeriana]